MLAGKTLVGTSNDILVFDVEDEPVFKIDLVQVIKDFGKVRQLLILPKSQSFAVLTGSYCPYFRCRQYL